MHHCNPVFKRFLGVFEVYFPAVQIYVSGVLIVNPEKTFHKCRFAGAVFAHKRVHGARLYGKINLVERLDARKSLFNVFHSKQNRLFAYRGIVCNASLLVHKPFSPVFLLTAAGYSGCCESYILFAGIGMIRDINSPLAYKVFAVKSVKGFLIA